ncbi:MAG: bioB [Nitrospirae bacterium]|nr:bioB [Nitrospirota bacterium]MBS1232781.1 bioB [Nitrospirota bacterium]
MVRIKHLEELILKGSAITKEEAASITGISGSNLFNLFALADKIRSHFRGDIANLCSIVNAKSGSCSENCSFCAQSSQSKAEIDTYPLLKKELIIQKAREAKRFGIKRFSLVTSGRKISRKNLLDIAEVITAIKDLGIIPCASLGLLCEDELSVLKAAGLDRYHHNLETSVQYFPQICSTHGYADKIRTIHAAHSVGLSLCSGGIFGLGETWQDRVEMAFALRKLNVDSVPINFLIPIKGTALGKNKLLHPFEALKIVSLYRLILPRKEIRICGGRMQVLGEFNSMIFLAGADGMITGNYLTTFGRSPEDDLKLIKMYGLRI